jgi:hypothetical protein
MDMPKMPREGAAHLAVLLPFGKLGSQPVSRHVLLAYTEDYAIEYLGRKLRPYWQRNGLTVSRCWPRPRASIRRSSSAARRSTGN